MILDEPPNLMVFYQQLAEFFLRRIPSALPADDDASSKTYRIDFLTHKITSLLGLKRTAIPNSYVLLFATNFFLSQLISLAQGFKLLSGWFGNTEQATY
jgi:hypothetical protein